MKNTIILFASTLFILVTNFTFSQNAYLYSTQQIQLEYATAPTVEWQSTNEPSNQLSDRFQDEGNIISISIVFEIVFTESYPPSINKESIHPSDAFYHSSTSQNNPLTEFIIPSGYAYHQHTPSQLYSALEQNLLAKACTSILCSSPTLKWVELDEESWEVDYKKLSNRPISTQGNWHFRIGPYENSNYFTPMQL
ncbi:MAG: hypothetical protein AAF985_06910 [Bacteroidota bacterium]